MTPIRAPRSSSLSRDCWANQDVRAWCRVGITPSCTQPTRSTTTSATRSKEVRTSLVVHAKATLLATGAGPTMYKMMAPSAEKTTDGLALAYRVGARFIDMEMVQFHPTGLLVGDSGMSGTVLEEGLRGVGGRLFNGRMERFMEQYDPIRLERSTRDVVSRSSYLEVMAGRGSPHGGVYIDVSHLGAAFVERHFPGMVERCRDVGF